MKRRLISGLLLLLGASWAWAGDRPLSEEERAAHHDAMFVVEAPRVRAPLPAQALNLTHLPVVGDQGSLGSCSAFAAAYYYKTYQEARENGWIRPDPATHPDRVASPMWAYNLSKQSTMVSIYGFDVAISYYDAMQLFATHGAATWADMPYADTNSVHELPSDPQVFRHALRWRARQIGRIPGINSPSGLVTLKHHLAGGDLAVVSIGAGGLAPNFYTYPSSTGSNGIHNAVFYSDHGTPPDEYGHALTLIGYDDNRAYVDHRDGQTHYGAFLAVNSWGPTWGVEDPTASSGGFVWLAYAYVMESGLGHEAVVMTDRESYEPHTLAVVGIAAPGADSLNNNFFRVASPRFSQRFNIHINAADPFEREFLLDISDWLEPPVMNLEVQAFHASYSAAPATVTVFRVENWAGDVLSASTSTPVSAVLGEMRRVPIASMTYTLAGLQDLRVRRGGAAFADVNGNGRPDLIVTGHRFPISDSNGVASTTLWLNQGDGTFAESSGHGLPGTTDGDVAFSDVNNNGLLDLWLATDADTRLYWNNGDGTFSDSALRLPRAFAGSLAPADFNRDGRPDIGLANTNGVFLCRQESNGSFTLMQLDHTGMDYSFNEGPAGMLAWGDLDGDGYPDLAATGLGADGALVIYRNAGDASFTRTTPDVPNLIRGALAWTDYDNDGLDDLILNGRAPAQTLLLRGNATGDMEHVVTVGALTGVFRGRLQTVDVNHDGRRDLLLTGREHDYYPNNPDYEYPLHFWPNRARVFANLGMNTFEEAQLDFPGVSGAFGPPPMAVADVTGDHNPDWFVSGVRRLPHETDPQFMATYLAVNKSASYPGHGGSNAPPAAPTSFSATAGTNGTVTFSWSGATDDTTPESGLRYLVRIGTTSGSGNWCSGVVPPTDFSRLLGATVTYRQLPAGTLYWQVRSVDAAGAVSPWSAEQEVTVSAYGPTYWVHPAAEPPYAGQVAPSNSFVASADASVPVTASAAPGFVFDGWSGSFVAGAEVNPVQLSVSNDVWAIARFVPREVVTPVPEGMGLLEISADPGYAGTLWPPAGTYQDLTGTVFAVRAEPASGFVFDEWIGPVDDPFDPETFVTLGTQTVVQARFAFTNVVQDGVTLTTVADPPDGGAVWPAAGAHAVERDEPHIVYATASHGWRFSHWSGPTASALARHTTVTPGSNVAVAAHFVRETLALGDAHSAVRWDEGTLWVWGVGAAGQSGWSWMNEGNGLPPLATAQGIGALVAGGGTVVARNTTRDGIRVWGAPWTLAAPTNDAWDVESAVLSMPLPPGNHIRQVVAGNQALLAVGDDGLLWSSGNNIDQQLAGAWAASTNLMPVPGFGGQGQLDRIAMVAMGHAHALAVDFDGRVWGWGRNHDGQVQPGWPTVVNAPAPLAGLPPVRSVAANQGRFSGMSYAIDWEDRLWQWGADEAPAVVAGVSNVWAIAAGGRHALALDRDGAVYAWGNNDYGQLGVGDVVDRAGPVRLTNLPAVVEIAAHQQHSAARTADGRLFVWGGNVAGGVNGASGTNVLSPSELAPMHPTNTSVLLTLETVPSVGGAIVPGKPSYRGRLNAVVPLVAVPAERYAFAHWQAGVADTTSATTTVTLAGSTIVRAHFDLLPDAVARLTIQASPAHGGDVTPPSGEHEYDPGAIVPLRADPAPRHVFTGWTGTVEHSGQRETAILLEQDEAVTAHFALMPFLAVPALAVYDNQPVLVYRDSGVRYTQLMQPGSPNPNLEAYRVQGPIGGSTWLEGVVQVAQEDHHLALTADGTVYAWGNNHLGQCGIGTSGGTVARASPVVGPEAESNLTQVIQVAAGYALSVAVTSDGRVYEWGRQLGSAGAVYTNRPTRMRWQGGHAVSNAAAVDVRSTYAAVRLRDGSVGTWNDSAQGVLVAGLSNVVAVAAGGSGHYLALLGTGQVKSWGKNGFGQLGDGTNQDRATPVWVIGLSNIAAIAAGDYHSMALDTAGRVYVWGYNSNGQLGDGTYDDRWTAAQVAGVSNVHAIAAGGWTTFALNENGGLYSWGALGDSHPAFATLTPHLQQWFNLGSNDVVVVRLELEATPQVGGAVFPGEGVTWYNAGDTIELRALPATDYRFDQWSDGATNAWREYVLTNDLVLAASFMLIEPELHAGMIEASPGETVVLPVWLEDGKIPYGGLNAALRLPPGVQLAGSTPGRDVPDAFLLDVQTRTWADDGSRIVSLAVFGPEGAISNRLAELVNLHVTVAPDAPGGEWTLEWMEAQAWAGGANPAMSDTNGLARVVPTRVNGNLTIHRTNLVQTALRAVTQPAATDHMDASSFDVYRGRSEFRTNEPFVVELWMRDEGADEAGILSARINLVAGGEDVVIEGLHHSATFAQHAGGTIDGQHVLAFGGTAMSGGEGVSSWVRLGWLDARAAATTGTTAWIVEFVEEGIELGNLIKPGIEDVWAVNSPLISRVVPAWTTTAKGTPHWWLEEEGLVDPEDGDYEAAEALDVDQDGQNAGEEFIAGTDPNDEDSYFRVEYSATLTAGGTGSMVLRWSSVAGRWYRIEATTNLLDGSSYVVLIEGLPATPPLNAYTNNPPPTAGVGAYRIKATLQSP